MLVKDLKRLLLLYKDELEVCIGIDFQGTIANSLCLANVDDGTVLAEADDSDFNHNNIVLLIKG